MIGREANPGSENDLLLQRHIPIGEQARSEKYNRL
jgi:hypothetical protein